jgi:hypothetical protein
MCFRELQLNGSFLKRMSLSVISFRAIVNMGSSTHSSVNKCWSIKGDMNMVLGIHDVKIAFWSVSFVEELMGFFRVD